MIYWMNDLETNGFSPVNCGILSSGSVICDDRFSVLDKRYHTCTVGRDRFITNVFNKQIDIWNEDAQKVHGISFEKQREFPEPIEMYRDMYLMLEQFPNEPITYVYHANGNFDIKHLQYHSMLHAPYFYKYMNKRLTFLEIGEHGEHTTPYRTLNTMSMAREYIKKGSDILKQTAKHQKVIDKMNGYLTKDRKTPAKPEKIREWMDKRAEAENALSLLETSEVVFEGYSLDKICKALDLKLEHHNAMSDAEVLVPIAKFLTENLS